MSIEVKVKTSRLNFNLSNMLEYCKKYLLILISSLIIISCNRDMNVCVETQFQKNIQDREFFVEADGNYTGTKNWDNRYFYKNTNSANYGKWLNSDLKIRHKGYLSLFVTGDLTSKATSQNLLFAGNNNISNLSLPVNKGDVIYINPINSNFNNSNDNPNNIIDQIVSFGGTISANNSKLQSNYIRFGRDTFRISGINGVHLSKTSANELRVIITADKAELTSGGFYNEPVVTFYYNLNNLKNFVQKPVCSFEAFTENNESKISESYNNMENCVVRLENLGIDLNIKEIQDFSQYNVLTVGGSPTNNICDLDRYSFSSQCKHIDGLGLSLDFGDETLLSGGPINIATYEGEDEFKGSNIWQYPLSNNLYIKGLSYNNPNILAGYEFVVPNSRNSLNFRIPQNLQVINSNNNQKPFNFNVAEDAINFSLHEMEYKHVKVKNTNNQIYNNIYNYISSLVTYFNNQEANNNYVVSVDRRYNSTPVPLKMYIGGSNPNELSSVPVTAILDYQNRKEFYIQVDNSYAGSNIWFKLEDDSPTDNHGGLYIKARYESNRDALLDNFVSNLSDSVAGRLSLTATNIFKNITQSSLFKGIVIGSLTLYIVLSASFFLMGISQENKKEFVIKMIKISLIITLLHEDNWNILNNYIFRLFTDSVDALIAAATGYENAKDAFKFLENGLNMFTNPDLYKYLAASIWGPAIIISYFLITGFYKYFIVIIDSLVAYFSALILIYVLIAISPIIFIFLLFKTTVEFFKKWFTYLFYYTMYPLLLILGVNFLSLLLFSTLSSAMPRLCLEPFLPIRVAGIVVGSIPFFMPSGDYNVVLSQLFISGILLWFYTDLLYLYPNFIAKLLQFLLGVPEISGNLKISGRGSVGRNIAETPEKLLKGQTDNGQIERQVDREKQGKQDEAANKANEISDADIDSAVAEDAASAAM